MIFKNRYDAGIALSHKLTEYSLPGTVVLGLARGGVAVASVIANELAVPLDVLVVKKLASQSDPELAIGALAPDHVLYVDWKLAHRLGIDEHTINKIIIPDVQLLVDERTVLYHRGRKHIEIREKTVIVVDDGAATGATMKAALAWVKKKKATNIVVALPVAPREFINKITHDADKCVVLDTPGDFRAVGQFYEEFSQLSDQELINLLHDNNQKRGDKI